MLSAIDLVLAILFLLLMMDGCYALAFVLVIGALCRLVIGALRRDLI